MGLVFMDSGLFEKGSVSEEPLPARASRQAQRSAVTRTALLAAAEQIFARDGFEAARIEDIALAAGRSRGAFYANFESKTELFLALRKQVVRKRAREIRESVKNLPDPAARDKAIKTYMVEEVLNERQLLLEIEFKLFALRRPEMLEELASKHLDASCRINEEELAPHMPEWRDKGQEAIRRNTLAIEAVLEGLALNHLFHGSVLRASDVASLLPGLIDKVVTSPCDEGPAEGCP
jgi:AcrR family transcriptional regulator